MRNNGQKLSHSRAVSTGFQSTGVDLALDDVLFFKGKFSLTNFPWERLRKNQHFPYAWLRKQFIIFNLILIGLKGGNQSTFVLDGIKKKSIGSEQIRQRIFFKTAFPGILARTTWQTGFSFSRTRGALPMQEGVSMRPRVDPIPKYASADGGGWLPLYHRAPGKCAKKNLFYKVKFNRQKNTCLYFLDLDTSQKLRFGGGK